MVVNGSKILGMNMTFPPEARFSKAQETFRAVKPFLVHLYLKTEKCKLLKRLV